MRMYQFVGRSVCHLCHMSVVFLLNICRFTACLCLCLFLCLCLGLSLCFCLDLCLCSLLCLCFCFCLCFCITVWQTDRPTNWYISPGHIALSWSSRSGPLPKFRKQYTKLKFWILEISMQPEFYQLAFCIANHFILPKSTRKQVNDPNWQKNFNNLWVSQYFKIG